MKARAILFCGLLLGMACAHGGEPDLAQLASNSDQVIWEAGSKALEKKQYAAARQYFKRIVDGFPQSQYAPSARLAIGDSYFKEGGSANYMLAIAAYREFLTVYPSHPRSDYAQFQVAESYFRQKNGPDRDQTDTRHALEDYQRLLEIYPRTEHVEAARGRIREVRQSLARAEFLAGYFYQRTRGACGAAIARYQGVLQEYPDYQRLDEVLYRLGECFHATGRSGEAPPHLNRLLSEYPQSEYLQPTRQLLAEIATAPVTPGAVTSPPASAGDGGEPVTSPAAPPAPTPSPPAPEPTPTTPPRP